MAASAIGSSLFSAFSFVGAGWLFSRLNHKGYEAEMSRHNRSLEKLAQAKQAWYEKEVKRKNHIQELKEQLNEANQDLNATNKSLIQLKKYEDTVNLEQIMLSDYYQPSDQFKQLYQTIAIVTLGLLSEMGLVKVLGMMLV